MEGGEAQQFSNQSTDALQSKLDEIERSLAWTFGRAGREGTPVKIADLKPIIDSAVAMRREIERRNGRS